MGKLSGLNVLRFIGLSIAAVSLAACSEPDRPSSDFPPVGLASTAIWLEEREALRNAARLGADQARAAEIQEARLQGDLPLVPTAVTVPERAQPTSTVGRAAQAFADICVASLPSMRDVAERMALVNQRDFGLTPENSNARGTSTYLFGGEPRGDIAINVAIDVGRRNINQCLVSVRRQNPSAVAQALVDSVAASGYAIQPIAVGDAQRAWSIAGAPAGTILKMNSRRNVLGQQLTGVWITWP